MQKSCRRQSFPPRLLLVSTAFHSQWLKDLGIYRGPLGHARSTLQSFLYGSVRCWRQCSLVIEMWSTSINRRKHNLGCSGFMNLVYRLLEDPSVVGLGDCPDIASDIRLDGYGTIAFKGGGSSFLFFMWTWRLVEVLVRTEPQVFIASWIRRFKLSVQDSSSRIPNFTGNCHSTPGQEPRTSVGSDGWSWAFVPKICVVHSGWIRRSNTGTLSVTVVVDAWIYQYSSGKLACMRRFKNVLGDISIRMKVNTN